MHERAQGAQCDPVGVFERCSGAETCTPQHENLDLVPLNPGLEPQAPTPDAGVSDAGADASADEHVKHLVLQTLLTSPGERVNRPTFGTGLLQMVFAGNGPDLQQSAEYLVRASLQEQLADRLTVDGITVDADESTLRIQIVYTLTATGERGSTVVEQTL